MSDDRVDRDELLDLDRELQAERARALRAERQARRLRDENERLRAQLDAVYSGETFRVGEAILKVPRRVKKAIERARSGPIDRTLTVRTGDGQRQRARGGEAVAYEVRSDPSAEAAYRAIAGRRAFADTTATNVAFAVSTADPDEGRGDLFTAIGLARALEAHGIGAVMLEPDRWYDPPDGTSVVVAMVAEPELRYEPNRLTADCAVAAWIRNATDTWAASPELALYDVLFASSSRTGERLSRAFDGPIHLLPIAVDAELFPRGPEMGDRVGVLSTINQWGPTNPRRVYRFLDDSGVDFPLALHGVLRGLPGSLVPYVAGPVSFFAVPGLYRQAKLVLDDQQDVNARFGNVNSRVYEALASGALPVTGAARGLEETGLSDVPTFDDATDIRQVVNRWLADDEGRQAIVERLRAQVLESHTYDVRATSLLPVLEGLRDDRPGRPGQFVAFSPDYRSTNPYQSMLYATLRAPEYAYGPVRDAAGAARVAAGRRVSTVFHLHWTAPVLGRVDRRGEAATAVDRYLDGVDRFRAAGGRLLWTIHNALPHDARFEDEERRLRAGIAERADAIHVMCERTVDIVAPDYELPRERVVVIPHGSYVDVYPNLVTQQDARAELGLPADATVLLFLGQVRPYKGLEDLIDAFESVAVDDPSLHLLVAGKPVNHPTVEEIARRCHEHPRIRHVLEAIRDEDLQVFHNAADVVVLPHRKVLNSGGVPLAYSFGRPVIAPDTGCIPSHVSQDASRLFGEEGLSATLRAVGDLLGEQARSAAYERARAFTYLDMARGLQSLIDGLAQGRR